MSKQYLSHHGNIGGKEYKNLIPYSIIYNLGVYTLFFKYENCKKTIIATSVSDNLISWQHPTDIIVSKCGQKIISGIAITRHDKTNIIYQQKGIFNRNIKLATKKDKAVDKYPLPIITRKELPRPFFCGRYNMSRVFYSGNSFYMLMQCFGIKGYRLELLSSPNLINWQYCYSLINTNKKQQFISPSIVGIANKQFMVYTDVTSFPLSKISACLIDIKNKKFELLDEEYNLGNICHPRTTVLGDGRVLLLGTIKDNNGASVMLTPRELNYTNGIIQRPIQELLDSRRTVRKHTSILLNDSMVTYKGYQTAQEIAVQCDISAGSHLTITLGDIVISYSKFSAQITIYQKTSTKNPICHSINKEYIGVLEHLDINIFQFENRVEAFVNGGKTVLSMAIIAPPVNTGFSVQARGKVSLALQNYQLTI